MIQIDGSVLIRRLAGGRAYQLIFGCFAFTFLGSIIPISGMRLWFETRLFISHCAPNVQKEISKIWIMARCGGIM